VKLRVVVVAKRSAMARFIADGSDPRVARLLKKGDPTVSNWAAAHREHMRTLEHVERVLSRSQVSFSLHHGAHTRFSCRNAMLVVTVGGDGTLLGASHHVAGPPVLGVNSAPRHSIGFFCSAHHDNFERMLGRALQGTLPKVKLTRMAVTHNGRTISKRILNEALYSHASPAATSRYILEVGRVHEEQRSSGFWIGTAAGSTGALRSAGGRVLPVGSEKLQLVVREPYAVRGVPYRLQRVLVPPSARVRVRSKMHDAAMFLDGPYKRISLRLGDVVEFQASDEPLVLLGRRAKR
jgi:NAD+ kinase